jgi:hypothetical protein
MYLDVEAMPVDTVMVERRMVTIDTKRGPTRVEIERLVPLPDKDTLPVQTQKNMVEWGEKANASNLERGLLPLPVELTTEILDYVSTIDAFFYHFSGESLNICFTMRKDSLEFTGAFYKNVGKALVRKCDGLSANPNLSSYIG